VAEAGSDSRSRGAEARAGTDSRRSCDASGSRPGARGSGARAGQGPGGTQAGRADFAREAGTPGRDAGVAARVTRSSKCARQ
jgi:hypothetical protein